MDKERKERAKLWRMLSPEQRRMMDNILSDILKSDDDEDEEKMAMSKSEALSFLHKLGNCHYGTHITISHDDETMEGIFIRVDDDGYVRYMAYDEDDQTLCYGKCAPMLIKFKGE